MTAYTTLQDSAASLAKDVLPALTKATTPDLTLDWFLDAYRISFAAAILTAVLLLIPQLVRTARGSQSGRETAESLILYFPLFLIGAMFGPLFGVVLVDFFHALATSFITWGMVGSVGTVGERIADMIEVKPTDVTGGVPIATLMMFLMVAALLLVLCVLIGQVITLYFIGVIIPIGLLLLIDLRHRKAGKALISLWVGILATHPLLFFLLSFAFNMTTGAGIAFNGSPSLETLVQFIATIAAIVTASAAPLIALKLAPRVNRITTRTAENASNHGSWGATNITMAVNRMQHRPHPCPPLSPPANTRQHRPQAMASGLMQVAASRANSAPSTPPSPQRSLVSAQLLPAQAPSSSTSSRDHSERHPTVHTNSTSSHPTSHDPNAGAS